MKLIKTYKFFVGSETKFVDSVPEGSKDIAENYWASLDNACLFFLIFLAVVSIGVCAWYFTGYNELPGRHYRRSHWIGHYIGAAIISLLGTAALGYILTNPTVKGSGWLIWDIAFGNFIYAIIIFGVLSVIWWLFLPTNAYRLIGKR